MSYKFYDKAMNYNLDIDSYIGYPISKGYVRGKLAECKGKPCAVRINSYGGCVQTALDIRQQFIDHGDVTAYIFGMTASAATILAMGAKKICMSKYAMMLVHPCSRWVDEWGQMNADELADTIKSLEHVKNDLTTIDHVMASIYAERTGKSVQDMKEAMTKAAWLTAEECKALGLIDDIIEEGEETKMTARMEELFTACGLPVPAAGTVEDPAEEAANDTEGYAERVADALVRAIGRLFGRKQEDVTSVEESPIIIDNMKENADFKTINALLKKDALTAAEDGTLQISAEDMAAIEKRITDLEESEKNLNGQLAALEAGDGDKTDGITVDEGKDNMSVIMADYNRLSPIL